MPPSSASWLRGRRDGCPASLQQSVAWRSHHGPELGSPRPTGPGNRSPDHYLECGRPRRAEAAGVRNRRLPRAVLAVAPSEKAPAKGRTRGEKRSGGLPRGRPPPRPAASDPGAAPGFSPSSPGPRRGGAVFKPPSIMPGCFSEQSVDFLEQLHRQAQYRLLRAGAAGPRRTGAKEPRDLLQKPAMPADLPSRTPSRVEHGCSKTS